MKQKIIVEGDGLCNLPIVNAGKSNNPLHETNKPQRNAQQIESYRCEKTDTYYRPG